MTTNKQQKSVGVIGANGDLGSRICKNLLTKGAKVKAIVRQSANIDRLKQIPNLNICMVDYNNFESLIEEFKDLDCIVCTLNGLEDVIIKQQTLILKAAEQAGVKRFIPSDFAIDFRNIKKASNRNLELRKEFIKTLDQFSIKITSILNGVFSDMLTSVMPLILFKINRVVYFGDSKQKIDFTTIQTTAEYTSSVALDENTPRYLSISSNSLSSEDLANIMTQITGKKYKLLNGGSLSMLKIYIVIAKFLDKILSKDKNNIYPVWQGMQYFYHMFSGKCKLHNLDNSRYNDVNWIDVKDLLYEFYQQTK